MSTAIAEVGEWGLLPSVSSNHSGQPMQARGAAKVVTAWAWGGQVGCRSEEEVGAGCIKDRRGMWAMNHEKDASSCVELGGGLCTYRLCCDCSACCVCECCWRLFTLLAACWPAGVLLSSLHYKRVAIAACDELREAVQW